MSHVIFEQTGGNQNFALIRSKGDTALFGRNTQQMKDKWQIKNKPLADFMRLFYLRLKILQQRLQSSMQKTNK